MKKKEWNGNSRSAQYSLAMKKKDSKEQRETDDFYATDPKALEMLLAGALVVSSAMLKCFAHDGIEYPEILQQMREGVNCLFDDHLAAYDNKEE